MKLTFFCISIALLSVPSVLAQEPEFTSSIELIGAPYLDARSKFLNKANRDLLVEKRDEKNATWRQKAQAEIFLGWMDHEKQYKELLVGSVIRDALGEPHYYWRRSKPLDSKFVPLLTELILKGGSHENAQTDAATALVLASLRGTKVDYMVFVSALEDPRFGKQLATRRAAAYVVTKIGAFEKQFDSARVYAALQNENDAATARLLLSAIAKHAARGGDTEKDKFATQLASDANIVKKVGEPIVMRTVGNIGGTEAVNVVAKYLGKTADEDQVFLTVGALARMENPNASSKLQSYAIDTPTLEFSEIASDALANKYREAISDDTKAAEDKKEAIDRLFDIYKIREQRGLDLKREKEQLDNIERNLTPDLKNHLHQRKVDRNWIE